MAGAPQKPAEVECFPTLSLPPPPSHAWTSPPPLSFFVRGPHYLETKAKVPADQPLLIPIAFDLLRSSSKLSNIMQHPQCRARIALLAARISLPLPMSMNGLTDREAVREPFIWAFNLQCPSKENHSLVMYFVNFHRPEKGSLLQRFLDGDDAFRNQRLKLLTNIPQGPQVVKLVVREKGSVCMIGKILNCTYTREKDYMEVDVDIGSAMIARAAFQLCVGVAALVTVDFAFVLEGRCRGELPERIVGAMRLTNIDFSSASSLHCHRLSHEPVEKDKHKASYKSLWKSLSKFVQAD